LRSASLVVSSFEKENGVTALGKAGREWGTTRAGAHDYIVVVLKNNLIRGLTLDILATRCCERCAVAV
jgi:hypothetical protein